MWGKLCCLCSSLSRRVRDKMHWLSAFGAAGAIPFGCILCQWVQRADRKKGMMPSMAASPFGFTDPKGETDLYNLLDRSIPLYYTWTEVHQMVSPISMSDKWQRKVFSAKLLRPRQIASRASWTIFLFAEKSILHGRLASLPLPHFWVQKKSSLVTVRKD